MIYRILHASLITFLATFACVLTLTGSSESSAAEQSALAEAANELVESVLTPTAPTSSDAKAVVTELVRKVMRYLETTENFTTEQVPLLVQEVLRYEMTMSIVGVLGSLALFAWSGFAYNWSRHSAEARLSQIAEHTKLLQDARFQESHDYYAARETCDAVFTLPHYGIPVSGLVGAVAGAITIGFSIVTLVQILIAPRLFLLEYLKDLVK